MLFYKRVITIHDICGLGHSSLAAALPVLSVLGHQAIPLPTSVLSTQTDGFSDFTLLDLTDNMQAMIRHWQHLDLKVDALYSGYLASPAQAGIVLEAMRTLVQPNHLTVIDPVLGDNGALYPTMGPEMVAAMRNLVAEADVITPNVTELLALCGLPLDRPEDVALKDLVRRVSQAGPRYIAVTSVEGETGETLTTLAYDRTADRFQSDTSARLPVHFPGTGDLFASVLTGHLLQGTPFMDACQKASAFVFHALENGIKTGTPPREGLPFESLLPLLLGSSFEDLCGQV